MTTRLVASCFEEASSRIWDKHPKAVAVIIKYLYVGWYECTVIF